MSEQRLDEDQWERHYRPIANHLDTNAPYNGWMFETFGEEELFIRSYDPTHVWTYLDGDGGLYIVAGRHFVNRLGYFITENPWESEELLVVVEEEHEYTVTMTATYFVTAGHPDHALSIVYEAMLGNDVYDVLGNGEVDLSNAKVEQGTHFTIEHPPSPQPTHINN